MLKKSKKGLQKALKSNLNLIKASLKGEKVRYRDRSYVLNEIEQLALFNFMLIFAIIIASFLMLFEINFFMNQIGNHRLISNHI